MQFFLLRSVRKLYMYMSQRMLRYKRKLKTRLSSLRETNLKKNCWETRKTRGPRTTSLTLLILSNTICTNIWLLPDREGYNALFEKNRISFTRGFLEPRLVGTGTIRGLEKILKCWNVENVFLYYLAIISY